ncbi:MAG: SdiA-regulated domain-containing protein [Ginsengibacter sp.]
MFIEKIKTVFSYLLVSAFLFSCQSQPKQDKNALPGYNLRHPKVIKLNSKLIEISGIDYYPKDSSVFAIIDEDGVFSKIYVHRNGETKSWYFDKKRDYEDVLRIDSTFYVLISNGDLETLNFRNDSVISNTIKYPGSDKKVNEFESLYFDKAKRNLVMVCKECKEDPKGVLSVWTFNIDSLTYNPDAFTIDVNEIAERGGINKGDFKPSATAVNPLTNEVYIISSIAKLLVVMDMKGKVLHVAKLDPDLFKQPEGLTFTPSGDLLISNEWAEEGSANILFYKRQK